MRKRDIASIHEKDSDFEMNQAEYQRLVRECEMKICNYLSPSEAEKFVKSHATPTRKSFFGNPLWKQKIETDCEYFLNMRMLKSVCRCGYSVRLYKNQSSIICPICGNIIKKGSA